MGLLVTFLLCLLGFCCAQTPVWHQTEQQEQKRQRRSLCAACSDARQMEKNRRIGGKNPQLVDSLRSVRKNAAELRVWGAVRSKAARGTWTRVNVGQVTLLAHDRMRKVAALPPGNALLALRLKLSTQIVGLFWLRAGWSFVAGSCDLSKVPEEAALANPAPASVSSSHNGTSQYSP